MPVESAADRLVFLDADDFGVEATWTKQGGGASTVTGIIDDGSAMDAAGLGASGLGQVVSRPSFVCRAADVPSGAAQGDTLSGTSQLGSAFAYRIVSIMPDNTGMSIATLEDAT